jgi:hypothetical protein
MAICGCGLPALFCQPAIAGGFIYADLRSKLNTHLAPQALFTQSSPGWDSHCYKLPLSKHTGGGDTALSFSGWLVYLQFMWDMGLPPLLWSFPPTAIFTSFPAPGCWMCATAPAFSGRLVYLQFCLGFPLLLLWCSGCSALFLHVFFVVIAYYSVFFLFSLGGGQSVQGAMLIWPRVVCRSTTCCLAHLVVHVFPSCLGAGIWLQPGSPPGFSA